MGLLSLIRRLFSRESKPGKADALIVGLGNPGEKYRSTRHNAGYMVVEFLEANFPVEEKGTFGQSEYSIIRLPPDRKAALVKPLTFMNRSGDSVKAWLDHLGLSAAQCLVIVDDFALPIGSVRLRKDGSHGGHNGLKSITEVCGNSFPRLRVGIGPLPEGTGVIDFVLGTFSAQEMEALNEPVQRAAASVQVFFEKGAEAAMSRYNR